MVCSQLLCDFLCDFQDFLIFFLTLFLELLLLCLDFFLEFFFLGFFFCFAFIFFSTVRQRGCGEGRVHSRFCFGHAFVPLFGLFQPELSQCVANRAACRQLFFSRGL